MGESEKDRIVVVSQPMCFPWVGMFEQMRLADVFIHYDDVQMPQGGNFSRRVQIKTKEGSKWLSIPVKKGHRLNIKDVELDESRDWRTTHLRTLRHAYARAPFCDEMLDLVESTYALTTRSLSELNIHAMEAIALYFGLTPRFAVSSELRVEGKSTAKLVALVRRFDGNVYVTGHGGAAYLDHALFEQDGIRVEYMDYQRTAYPQLHGEFDPHVSILDLIANVGRDGARYIRSGTLPWTEFVNE